MTLAAPSGARPRRGRPRHHESPRARVRAQQSVHPTIGDGTTRPIAATQLASVIEVDLTGVAAELVLANVAAAVVRSAGQHPSVAGRIDPDNGSVVRTTGVSLGVLPVEGTTWAVVENADDLTGEALARQLADEHHHDGGYTLGVIHTGSLGALLDTPALGRDRASVLGIGAVVRRPVVMPSDGGEVIAVRAMAHLSLSYDPRLLGGADAAQFLQSVRQAIEKDSS